MSIVGRSKGDKKLNLLTYMSIRVCIYVRDHKFCFLKSTRVFFIVFGDNVSRSGSRQKNVACFFTLCPVCPCLSLTGSGMPSLIKFLVIYTLWWGTQVDQNRILLSFIAGPKIQACRHFLNNQITYLFWSLNIFRLISF